MSSAVAYHEAGHVVVAWLETVGVRLATIVPDDNNRAGRVHHEPTTTPETECRIAMGGVVAEWIRFPDTSPEPGEIADDMDGISRALEAWPPDDRTPRFHQHIDETGALLRMHWGAVERVASALLEHKTLDFAALEQLLDELCDEGLIPEAE